MKVAYVLLLALMAVAVAANNDIIKHGTVFKPVDKLPLGDDATYIRATDDWTLSLSMDVETDSLTVLALKNINVVFKENGVVDVLKSTTRATFKLGAKVGVNRDIAYVTPDWVSSDDNAPRAVLLSDMKTALFLDLSVNPKGVVSLEGWVVESKFEFTPAVINGAQQFWTYNGKNMIYYDVNGKEPVASGADYNIVHSDVYTTNNGIVLFHNVDKSLKTLQYLTDMDGMKTLNTVVNTAGLTAINKVACSTQACYYLASTTTAPGKQSIVNAVVYNANSAYDAVHTIDNEQYSLFAVDHVTFDNKDLYSSFLLSYPNGITTTTVQYFASISKKTLSGGVTVNDLPLDARGELSASSDIASFQSLAGGLSITYVQDPKTLAPSSLVFNSKGSTPLALPRAMGTKNCKNKIATANILSASLRTDATSTYLEYYSVKTKKTAPTMSSVDLKTRNNFDTVVPHFTGSLCSKQVVKSVGFSFWLANDDQIAPYFVTSAGFIIEDVIPQDVETSPTLFLATFGVASLLIIIWGTIAAVKKPPTVEGGDAEYQTLDA